MTETKKGWFARLTDGLAKSSARLAGGITDLFTRKKLDDATLEELEELLIAADLGLETASRLTTNLARNRFDSEITEQEVREAFAADIAELLEPHVVPLAIKKDRRPHVILVVGVNGSGKTTTVGKLAKLWGDAGTAITLVAGDTFRAAAVEQLQIWGERTGCPVITGPAGSDPAGLVFDALRQAQEDRQEVLLIDTAGRLHNKKHLMSELDKIVRVLRKLDPDAPHDCVLVLDATVGQNAHQQVQTFRDVVEITGLILTKLDGTAKGGVIVALAEKYGLPVHAVGVGEGAEDLRPFSADHFARSLMGLPQK